MSDRVMFEAQGIDVFYGTSQILFDVSVSVVEGQRKTADIPLPEER